MYCLEFKKEKNREEREKEQEERRERGWREWEEERIGLIISKAIQFYHNNKVIHRDIS
jgi:hypothetical protein